MTSLSSQDLEGELERTQRAPPQSVQGIPIQDSSVRGSSILEILRRQSLEAHAARKTRYPNHQAYLDATKARHRAEIEELYNIIPTEPEPSLEEKRRIMEEGFHEIDSLHEGQVGILKERCPKKAYERTRWVIFDTFGFFINNKSLRFEFDQESPFLGTPITAHF